MTKTAAGRVSIDELRDLFGNYVIVRKNRQDDFIDISRTGCIHQTTEHAFFVKGQMVVSFWNLMFKTPAVPKAAVPKLAAAKKNQRSQEALVVVLGRIELPADAAISSGEVKMLKCTKCGLIRVLAFLVRKVYSQEGKVLTCSIASEKCDGLRRRAGQGRGPV